MNRYVRVVTAFLALDQVTQAELQALDQAEQKTLAAAWEPGSDDEGNPFAVLLDLVIHAGIGSGAVFSAETVQFKAWRDDDTYVTVDGFRRDGTLSANGILTVLWYGESKPHGEVIFAAEYDPDELAQQIVTTLA